MEQETNIILCIPGPWETREALLEAVIKSNNGEYLFAGNLLFHQPSNEGFEMEVREHDHQIAHAFATAGMQRFSEAEMQAVKDHTQVVYIQGKGGSLPDAEKMMRAGLAVLKAGGAGIKVETAGKAFNKTQWEELTLMDHDHKFYEAFVLLVKGTGNIIYSCGMHNLGFRDAISDPIGELMETAELVDIFCIYQVLENPEIAEGQTFSTEPESPVYRIHEEACTFYPADDLFFNPYGMLHLVRI